ncbi:unnamed protein product, partial [marine sediment metagenome]
STVQGYNPIQNNQTGPYGPQLTMNTNFDQGTVRGWGGGNVANNPNGFGWLLSDCAHRVGTQGNDIVAQNADSWDRSYKITGTSTYVPISIDKKLSQEIKFPRPLRVLRNREIFIQAEMLPLTTGYLTPMPLEVSILYTEIPNPRESYRT